MMAANPKADSGRREPASGTEAQGGAEPALSAIALIRGVREASQACELKWLG